VGLALKLQRSDANRFSTKAFEKMNKLRLIQLADVKLDGDFDYLSRKLRWLCWNGFALTCIPAKLYRGNLVSVQLENSNVKLVWEENQVLILNLIFLHFMSCFHFSLFILLFFRGYLYVIIYGTFNVGITMA